MANIGSGTSTVFPATSADLPTGASKSSPFTLAVKVVDTVVVGASGSKCDVYLETKDGNNLYHTIASLEGVDDGTISVIAGSEANLRVRWANLIKSDPGVTATLNWSVSGN